MHHAGLNRFVKSMPFTARPMGGLMMSLTSYEITRPKAAPMITGDREIDDVAARDERLEFPPHRSALDSIT
ncbi:MAG TPA: hypothetical protein VGZ23_13825 [bacterium]|nr:hypothetical protein [bacterium]